MISWDTGPLFAAADVDDGDHARCVELMRCTPPPLLMPVPVLTEVGYLLEREKGARAEAEFLRSIRAGQVVMVPLTAVIPAAGRSAVCAGNLVQVMRPGDIR